MHYNGIAKGKVIEFEEPLPFANGQPVRVSVQTRAEQARPGSPERVLQAMRGLPRITREDTEALERAIEEGKLPVRYEGIFDE